MTTDSVQTPYAESRTGRGDKWFQEISDLRAQTDALVNYAEAHKMFSAMIGDGLTTLPVNDSREIARAELQEFISKRIAHAQQTIRRKLTQIQALENRGVE